MSVKKKVTLYAGPEMVSSLIKSCPNAFIIYSWVCAQCRIKDEEWVTVSAGIAEKEFGMSRKQYRLAIEQIRFKEITVCESTPSGTAIWANLEAGRKAQQTALFNKGSDNNKGQGEGQPQGHLTRASISDAQLKQRYKIWLKWFNDYLADNRVQKHYKFDPKAFNHYKKNFREKAFSGEDYAKALGNALQDDWLKNVTHYNALTPEFFLRPENTNKYLNMINRKNNE